MNDSMSGTDSSALAALADGCPFTDGNAVYLARALYVLVFNSVGNFDDVCGSGISSKPGRPDETQDWNIPNLADQEQAYRLHPNPSNGNIYIQQLTSDDKPVQTLILNGEGKVIFKDNIVFYGGTRNINLSGITPGIYLVELIDSDGKQFVIKFIVNR